MTATLRALERDWKASGSAESEAALIQAQSRAGVLLESRLRLAALLGHPAAVLASGAAEPGPLLCDLCFEITEFGRKASIRTAVAAARLLLERWSWPHPEANPQEVLNAVEAWLSCPCPTHEANCRGQADELYNSMVAHEGEPDLGVVIHQTDRSRPANAIYLTAYLTSRAELDDDSRRTAVRVVTEIEQALDAEYDLRDAIRNEVVPWALGRRDVVQERVDALLGREAEYVTYFGQRLTRDWAEALDRAQQERAYRVGSASYPRIPYGSETFRDPQEAMNQPCRHCNTLLGKLHDPDCDYEQCPACNRQIMSCDCEFEGHEWRELDDD